MMPYPRTANEILIVHFVKSKKMSQLNYEPAIINFYQKNASKLLSNEEIMEICQKKISSSEFWICKQLVLEICKKEKIIFGFPEGILFTELNFHVFVGRFWGNKVFSYPISDFLKIEANNKTHFPPQYGLFKIDGVELKTESNIPFNITLYDELKLEIEEVQYEAIAEEKRMIAEKERIEEENRRKRLVSYQDSALLEFDTDGNGEIDLIKNDFNDLLSSNQKQIIDIDKKHVHEFVKISNFIKTKRSNIQNIFESIRETSNVVQLVDVYGLLKNQIHTYELLVFHSINMIGALLSEDLITFYEIHESFDKLGIFNSNWENEVSEKLKNIGDKISDLMYSIHDMEQNMVNELRELNYTTSHSFKELNVAVTKQLNQVNSSIKMNNLLTGIQTYQLYKINKNTKR